MLKRFREMRLNREIETDQKMLQHMVSQTEEIKERVFGEIIKIKQSKSLDWSQTLKDPDVKESLFQLMLHRQFIGQLAENIRQKTFVKLRLLNQFSSGLDKKAYREMVEGQSAKNEMIILQKLFELEMLPLLKEYEENET